MSFIWNFSPSLENQVQLCITAARKEKENKWLREFGHLKCDLNATMKPVTEAVIDLCNSEDIIKNNEKNFKIEAHEDTQDQKTEVPNELDSKNIEELIENLDADYSNNIDFMITQCINNDTFLSLLAKRLPTNTIEKLCLQIYDKKDINKVFLSKFFEYFLPAYILREYNSSTLDILIRGSKNCPLEFKKLLKLIFKDLIMPLTVLQDYVLTLNENDRSKFIMDAAEFDLTGEEFVNNLFSLYTAYRDCTKSEKTQKYVESMLKQYSPFCVSDRNYGRLFMTYLQTQKALKSSIEVDYEGLEKLLEEHKSPFKRPCLTLIKELIEPNDSHDSTSDDEDDSE